MIGIPLGKDIGHLYQECFYFQWVFLHFWETTIVFDENLFLSHVAKVQLYTFIICLMMKLTSDSWFLIYKTELLLKLNFFCQLIKENHIHFSTTGKGSTNIMLSKITLSLVRLDERKPLLGQKYIVSWLNCNLMRKTIIINSVITEMWHGKDI